MVFSILSLFVNCRMAELQQLNLSSNEPEQTTTGIMAVNAARINFGLPVHQVLIKHQH